MVSLQPVAAKPGVAVTAPRRVPTALDGSFVFKQLVPGTYGLCAQIPSEQVRRGDSPFLDSCLWGSLQNAQVSAGQSASGVQIVSPQGAYLQIRVNDPDGLLPKTANPVQMDALLRLAIRTQNQAVYPVRTLSQDTSGRTYAIVVPFGTPVSLSATSAQATLFNSTGQQVQADIPMQVPAGSTPAPVSLTIHR